MKQRKKAGEGYCWAGHWQEQPGGRIGESCEAARAQRLPQANAILLFSSVVPSLHSNPDSIFNAALKTNTNLRPGLGSAPF